MTIGTGIFLSSLIIACLLLYRWTYQRWDWKKLFKNFFKYSVAIIVVLGGCSYLFVKYQNRPIVQDEYNGIKLGMSQKEVAYIKGFPPTVLEPYVPKESDPPWLKFSSLTVIASKDMPEGKTYWDYYDWEFSDTSNRIQVGFDFATKTVNEILCFKQGTGYCPSVLGISLYSSEQDVIDRLGKPDESKIDNVTKTLFYNRLNLKFYLTQQNIYMIGIVGKNAQ